VRGRRASVGTLALTTLLGCGGVTRFSDTTPIVLARSTPTPSPAPATVETPHVEVQRDRIVISEKIQFATDKADILPASHGLLDELVTALHAHKDITKIDIVGHTDDGGAAKYNQALSEKRANSVRTYLVSQGIDADRLLSTGFGEAKPIADNTTSQGREQNRRVEFLILEHEGTSR
jgi:OmpA-OmpF porin, OOP family